MIGIMYGEPWNCPEEPPEPMIRFKVDVRPPVDLRDLLAPGVIVFVEEPPRWGWRERFKDFMLALAEGTDP